MSNSPLAQPLMSSRTSDPFHAFRDEVKTQVDRTSVQFDQWRDLLHSVNTAENGQFQTLNSEVKQSLSSTESGLRGCELAVGAVERNRAKFPHIDDAELASRKAFVQSMRDKLATMKTTVTGRAAQGKIEQDRHRMLTARRAEDRAGASGMGKYEAANEDFIDEQKARGQMLMQQQDEHLTVLDDSVARLGQMATGINVELQEQAEIIDELDTEVSEVQTRMDQAMKHIEKLLKTKNKCQIWTIVFLILVLLGVTVAVFTGG